MESEILLLHARGLPLDIILSQLNPVKILKPHSYSAQFNMIFLSTPRWFLPFRFYAKNFVIIAHITYECCISHPFFILLQNRCWKE